MNVHILFYPGQRVKCINDRGVETSIRAGQFYTVRAVHRGDKAWGLEISGSQRQFNAERFVTRSVADTEIDRQSWPRR